MRRWLAILLLVLLPAQFAWSAVASYCAHESGAGVDHLGHHACAPHASGDTPGSDPAAGNDGGSAAQVDCSHCHGHVVGLLMPLRPGSTERLDSAPADAALTRRLDPASPTPERPQWARLA